MSEISVSCDGRDLPFSIAAKVMGSRWNRWFAIHMAAAPPLSPAATLSWKDHAANLEQGGTVLDQAALNEAVVAENWASAEALITDDIVRRHAASGRPEQVQRRFAAYQATGLDEIVVSGARDGAQLLDIMRAV